MFADISFFESIGACSSDSVVWNTLLVNEDDEVGYNDPPTWGDKKLKSKADNIDINVAKFIKAATEMKKTARMLWKDVDLWRNWFPYMAEEMKYSDEWSKIMRTISTWSDEYKISNEDEED